MHTYRKNIQEAVKSRSARLEKAVQTHKLLNRLASISSKLQKGSITHRDAERLYTHEASRASRIKQRIASLKGR
jgi:hypothetical protein